MPIVREKYGKAQAFQSYWFLKYFVQFPKHGESKFPQDRKIMRKPTHSKVMGFLNISGEEEIHKIPKLWDE